jgi:predicted ester cyclase
MPPEENKSIVQEFYDQGNSGAIDFDRLVHEDVTNDQPDRSPERGLDKFRQAIEEVMGAVPGLPWTTLELIAEGDRVVCHNSWSGTYGGTIFRAIATPDPPATAPGNRSYDGRSALASL